MSANQHREHETAFYSSICLQTTIMTSARVWTFLWESTRATTDILKKEHSNSFYIMGQKALFYPHFLYWEEARIIITTLKLNYSMLHCSLWIYCMIFERGLFSRLYRMWKTDKRVKCIVIDCYQRLLSVRQHVMIAELHLTAGSAVWKKASLLASRIPSGIQLEKQLLHFVVLSPTLDLPRYSFVSSSF